MTSPAPEPDAVRVEDDPNESRYVARVGAEVAGFAAYRFRSGRMVFTHTEVEPEYEGRGVGSTLAHEALEDVRRRGLRIVALCPFISAYLRRHPEYADLAEDDPLA